MRHQIDCDDNQSHTFVAHQAFCQVMASWVKPCIYPILNWHKIMHWVQGPLPSTESLGTRIFRSVVHLQCVHAQTFEKFMQASTG